MTIEEIDVQIARAIGQRDDWRAPPWADLHDSELHAIWNAAISAALHACEMERGNVTCGDVVLETISDCQDAIYSLKAQL